MFGTGLVISMLTPVCVWGQSGPRHGIIELSGEFEDDSSGDLNSNLPQDSGVNTVHSLNPFAKPPKKAKKKPPQDLSGWAWGAVAGGVLCLGIGGYSLWRIDDLSMEVGQTLGDHNRSKYTKLKAEHELHFNLGIGMASTSLVLFSVAIYLWSTHSPTQRSTEPVQKQGKQTNSFKPNTGIIPVEGGAVTTLLWRW